MEMLSSLSQCLCFAMGHISPRGQGSMNQPQCDSPSFGVFPLAPSSSLERKLRHRCPLMIRSSQRQNPQLGGLMILLRSWKSSLVRALCTISIFSSSDSFLCTPMSNPVRYDDSCLPLNSSGITGFLNSSGSSVHLLFSLMGGRFQYNPVRFGYCRLPQLGPSRLGK